MKNERTVPSARFQVSREGCSRLLETENLKLETHSAFTLVELLVVISIIGVIAAFLLPVAGAVKKNAVIHTAQTEMAQLETAIDRYKSAYGFYPPDNTNTIHNLASALTNQLYYELVGTTNSATGYQPLGGGSSLTAGGAASAFGVIGFMNCNKPNADESTAQARNFLPDLKPRQIGTVNGVAITNLVTSVGGPDPTYKPLGLQDMNPWRYYSSNPANNPAYNPQNNPGSYDLWVQLVIGRETNLICNWSKQVQINNPLP